MRISLSDAVQKIKQQVIAVPTETVYGLAASLHSLSAIEQIFALKGRPLSNPLIIHVADVDMIHSYCQSFPPLFEELAQAFWPGPLTLILPIEPSSIYSAVRAGLPTAGFRIPAHPLTLELLKQTGPLVMPSANLSGRPSSTSPDHVEEDFGKDFPVLDGGMCHKGVESTILMYHKERWIIVRLGALAPQDFASVLGYEPEIFKEREEAREKRPLCPGQLFRHYAPKARLMLRREELKDPISFVLGFSEREYPQGHRIIEMGSIHAPKEVMQRLYHCLRQLDVEEAKEAWVDMDFPREGLWLTIAERLERAAQNEEKI